jgi:hypothetical protein
VRLEESVNVYIQFTPSGLVQLDNVRKTCALLDQDGLIFIPERSFGGLHRFKCEGPEKSHCVVKIRDGKHFRYKKPGCRHKLIKGGLPARTGLPVISEIEFKRSLKKIVDTPRRKVPIPVPRFACNKCTRLFRSISLLKAHQEGQGKKNPDDKWSCPYCCAQWFPSALGLNRHLVMHKEDPRYIADREVKEAQPQETMNRFQSFTQPHYHQASSESLNGPKIRLRVFSKLGFRRCRNHES